MKVTITIHYAGQTKKFTGLEFPDDDTWQEVYTDFAEDYHISAINEATNEEVED